MSEPSYNPPLDYGLDLVYCDDSLLVVNKPTGLLSVPGRGLAKADSLTTRVQKAFHDARCVHRLDMSTSGLLIFARNADMHQRLSRLFREREIHKSYIAIVKGRIETTAGEIDLPLVSDWPNRPLQKVDFFFGKSSLTRYRLLEYIHTPVLNSIDHEEPCCITSRVELEPVTGRTHQLRVHMSAVGHPVLGDELYNANNISVTGRLLLHARELRFVHPLSAEPLGFICEPLF